MNAIANVDRRELAPIEVLKHTVARKADDFKMVLPSHITVDKFQRTIATAALSNPQLLTCNKQSLLIAAMKLAQDGLLPDGREAALVPFKTWNKESRETIWQVQAMPMAWGVRKKILQSGMVISLETGLVYRAETEGGHFIYEIGMDPPIRHRPKLDMTDEEMADENIVAAYSIARLKNEGGEPYWSVEVMRRSEINKVRQASQTGALGKTTRDGKPIPPKGPWVDWFGEMARKTVLRRHSKVLPMSGDLLDTFERDDAEEERARGAARLLEAQEEKPLTLPSAQELDGLADDSEVVDETTGEVIQRDSRGMTEVDEETARRLDAQQGNDGTLSEDNPTAAEGPADEQRGEAHAEAEPKDDGRHPEADFRGPVAPKEGQAGQTWYNTAKRRILYAHDTQHGLKWYVDAPKSGDQQGEAAQGSASESEADRLRSLIADAADMSDLADADRQFNEAKPGLKGDDITAIRELMATRRNELS